MDAMTLALQALESAAPGINWTIEGVETVSEAGQYLDAYGASIPIGTTVVLASDASNKANSYRVYISSGVVTGVEQTASGTTPPSGGGFSIVPAGSLGIAVGALALWYFFLRK